MAYETESRPAQVDVNVPRFNQAVLAALVALAFVVQVEWLIAVAFGILLISYVGGPTVAPLTQAYVRYVRPRVDPGGPSEFEDARPPRFSQLLGTVFLGAAVIAFLTGIPVAGWALALIVMALAALAAATRICVGCILYEKAVQR